eukprot:m.259806 g.259806  ORF g.259806 m.259806 type:complete len:148 (-) comp38719_c0_seq1:39-482(-)
MISSVTRVGVLRSCASRGFRTITSLSTPTPTSTHNVTPAAVIKPLPLLTSNPTTTDLTFAEYFGSPLLDSGYRLTNKSVTIIGDVTTYRSDNTSVVSDSNTDIDGVGIDELEEIQAGSLLKKRRRKMNHQKYRKWRKKMRTLLRKLK